MHWKVESIVIWLQTFVQVFCHAAEKINYFNVVIYLRSQGFFFLVIEEDPDTGLYFVGRGGLPNSKGILECDAAVMDGDTCRFGAVAALQGY